MKGQIGLGKILIGLVVITILGIAGITGARMIIAPSFKAANNDYRYQWHRVANEQEWKEFKVKYRGSSYCKDCHTQQFKEVGASLHAKVSCESCHGPAINHPDNPARLTIDNSRSLCLRCHSDLPYRRTQYSELPKGEIKLKMVDPDIHNPEMECIACHNPHKTDIK
jgi:predicted CXXCH cytochrome family protein